MNIESRTGETMASQQSPASTLVYRAQMFITLDGNANPSQFQIVHFPVQLSKAEIRLAAKKPANEIITFKYTRDSGNNLHDVDITSNMKLPSDADLTKMILGQYTEQQRGRSPFDRTPISVGGNYVAGGITSHGLTVRSTYTVPAGRICLIAAAHMEIYCDLGGIGAGWYCEGRLSFYSAQGGAFNSILAGVFTVTNNTPVTQDPVTAATINSQLAAYAEAGDTIKLRSQLAASGATTANFVLTWTGTEFSV